MVNAVVSKSVVMSVASPQKRRISDVSDASSGKVARSAATDAAASSRERRVVRFSEDSDRRGSSHSISSRRTSFLTRPFTPFPYATDFSDEEDEEHEEKSETTPRKTVHFVGISDNESEDLVRSTRRVSTPVVLGARSSPSEEEEEDDEQEETSPCAPTEQAETPSQEEGSTTEEETA